MDFVYHYTQEQERFRREVSDCLDAHVSGEVLEDTAASGLPEVGWDRVKSVKKLLGNRGWLLPAFTENRDGGGLTQSFRLVLWEELEKRGLLALMAEAGWSLADAIVHWGTESQIGDLLPALGRGEICFWRQVIEPGVEPDAAELTIEAAEDSDEYVLDGRGMFSGLAPQPDYLWTLAHIQREGVPDLTTASFLVPTGLQGIAFHPTRQLVDGIGNPVRFAQVRVPRSCMLGHEGDGWFLMGSSLLGEQAVRNPNRADAALEELLRYADETSRDGMKLSEEPVLQQLLMEAYTNSRLLRLLRTRDAWLRDSGALRSPAAVQGNLSQRLHQATPLGTYQEAQTRLWEKRNALRLAEIVREMVGLYAFLDGQDPRVPAGGKFELQQRSSLALHSGTPGVDWEAGIIAEHLGMGQRSDVAPDGPLQGVPARWLSTTPGTA